MRKSRLRQAATSGVRELSQHLAAQILVDLLVDFRRCEAKDKIRNEMIEPRLTRNFIALLEEVCPLGELRGADRSLEMGFQCVLQSTTRNHQRPEMGLLERWSSNSPSKLPFAASSIIRYPRTNMFFSTKHAPPALRIRLQRSSASPRVSAPIRTT
jgi:hypothetical protein